jgi:hypothetical protein
MEVRTGVVETLMEEAETGAVVEETAVLEEEDMEVACLGDMAAHRRLWDQIL